MPRIKTFCEQGILTKAMELFWKKGFHATSIQDLVKHLGINRASLYDTYGGKMELFEKAFKHYSSTNLEGLANFLNQFSLVKEGLRNMFEFSLNESACDSDHKGCFVVNSITELVPGNLPVNTLLEQHVTEVKKVLHTYIQKGQTAGQIQADKDLDTLTDIVFVLFSGFKVVTKIENNKEKSMASVEAVLSLLS